MSDRRLIQGPRPITNGDMGRDCCHQPHVHMLADLMHCRNCGAVLVAAWHGEDNKIHTSVDGKNEPLEFP